MEECAMDYDPNSIFQQVAAVASKGWKVVRLWGVRDNLTCTCGRPNCPTPGKHPHGGPGWPDRATDSEDEIWSWFEKVEEHTRSNVGLKLGPSSGVIDVEFDSPEAEAVLKKYGLHLIDTPTYKAGRGEHRIFQCDDGLPDAGVVKVDGLEVRLGGGEAASQSVIPPSWHKSGVQYQWLPGKSPSDVSPAPLPDSFRQAVLDSSRKRGSGVVAQSLEVLRGGGKITEGGRHAFLVGIASRFAGLFRNYTDNDLTDLTTVLLGANMEKCEPPKTRDEVVKIAKDQFSHYKKKYEDRRNSNLRPLEQHGLAWNAEERRWEPGEWRLTIVESDPPEYKLHLPVTAGGIRKTLTVSLDVNQWLSAKGVAVAVLEASNSIDLQDPCAAKWASIWLGEVAKDHEGNKFTIRGMKSQLFDIADREVPPHESNVSASNAAVIYQYLRFGFAKSEDGSETDRVPNLSGLPKWIQDEDSGEWALWLKWEVTVNSAYRKAGRKDSTMGERRTMMRQLLAEVGEKKIESEKKTFSGGNNRWFLFRERHIEALARLSGAS
jgi:hypothetical protein